MSEQRGKNGSLSGPLTAETTCHGTTGTMINPALHNWHFIAKVGYTLWGIKTPKFVSP